MSVAIRFNFDALRVVSSLVVSANADAMTMALMGVVVEISAGFGMRGEVLYLQKPGIVDSTSQAHFVRFLTSD